jgi:hypothetical protein
MVLCKNIPNASREEMDPTKIKLLLGANGVVGSMESVMASQVMSQIYLYSPMIAQGTASTSAPIQLYNAHSVYTSKSKGN